MAFMEGTDVAKLHCRPCWCERGCFFFGRAVPRMMKKSMEKTYRSLTNTAPSKSDAKGRRKKASNKGLFLLWNFITLKRWKTIVFPTMIVNIFFGEPSRFWYQKKEKPIFPWHIEIFGGGGVSYRCQCHGHLSKCVHNSHVYEGKHFLLMEPLEEE